MLQNLLPYRFIIMISVIGFTISGIIAAPFYAYWWDSTYTFTKFSIENLPPTNWMGWFYVYFWDFLYKIFGTKASIGVFHNIAYWISMPIIYINFFDKPSQTPKFFSAYTFWYLCLVLNPVIFGFFFGVTNNVFVASFLVMVLACYALYFRTSNKFVLGINFLLLLIMIFIRRDTLILVFPMLIYTGYLLVNKKILYAIILVIGSLIMQKSIDSIVIAQIPRYHEYQAEQLSIDTEGIVIAYDLLAMGWYKKELLFPDDVLVEKYRASNRHVLNNKIIRLNVYDAIFTWGVLQDLGWDMFDSGTTWHSGLTLKNTWQIYLKNFHFYLWVKLNMFYAYALYLWPQLILSLVALWILFSKKTYNIFTQEKKNFLALLIFVGWLFSGAVILSVNGIQARYLLVPNILLWFASLYSIAHFTKFFRINIIKKTSEN